MKLFRIILNILFGVGLIFNFLGLVYVDEKVNDLDNAVFQYMKDEHNEMIAKMHGEK